MNRLSRTDANVLALSYALFGVAYLALVGGLRGDEPSARVRAALALASAGRAGAARTAAKPNCGCGGPGCECGAACDCLRGTRNCSGGCACERGTRAKKTCACSPECTCGCNQGEPCACGDAAVRLPAQTPTPAAGPALHAQSRRVIDPPGPTYPLLQPAARYVPRFYRQPSYVAPQVRIASGCSS